MGVLFVPFALEAYVTDNTNQKYKDIMPVSPNYASMSSILGGKLEPKSGDRDQIFNVAGVYLHFILPDALTHATLTENGQLKYPLIPNRWIVTRLYLNKQSKICVKSWVVESDYLGTKDDNLGKDKKDSVSVPYFDDATVPYRYLGRCYPINDTTVLPAKQTFPLTAIGAGDSTFAAYYPNCRSVLGFHDKLDEVPMGSKITYFVMGYYANSAQDPLTSLDKDKFVQYLIQNNWKIANFPSPTDPDPVVPDPIPEKTVFHGMLYSLAWEGPDHEYSSGEPTGEVYAAVGNTSVEAISALISSMIKKEMNCTSEDAQSLERSLAAVQYELMDDFKGTCSGPTVDGVQKTEDLIHESEFDPSTGGTLWQVRVNDNSSKNDEAEKQVIPQHTGELLSALNAKQATMDQLVKKREWLQNALFSAWYSYIDSLETPPSPYLLSLRSKLSNVINNLCKELDSHSQNAESKAKVAVEEAKKALESNIVAVSDWLKLESVDRAPFYRPKEPVILLGGSGINRPYAYGHDKTLTCREKAITQLSTAKKTVLTKEYILHQYCQCENFSIDKQPSEFSDLLCEAICLSTELTNYIATKEDTSVVIPDPKEDMPDTIAYYQWTQPWTTLFLEWNVHYTPTRSQSNPDDSLKNWRFDEIDYTYDIKPSTERHTCSGRTVLTPHATKLLRETLQPKLERYKDLIKDFEEVMHLIENLSIVSQQLGGFHLQLLSKHATLQLPIMDHPDDEHKLAGKVHDHLKDANLTSIGNPYLFFPIRAGFLQIDNVNIINSFGLTQEIRSILSEHPTIFSEQLDNSKLERSAMLPPRFSQGARLCFDWISHRDNNIISSIDPDDSPICGYLYPDMLNYNLMVYDYDGTHRGMLKIALRNSQPQVRWIGEDLGNIKSKHLQKFIEALTTHDKNDPAFAGLMKLIDNRLEASCAFTEGDDLSVLWGRPLVLARARILFELEGPEAHSQKDTDFGELPHNIENIKIPVFIGDITRSLDGTIGYFPDTTTIDEQYRTMHCVYKAKETSTKTKYLTYNSPITTSASNSTGVHLTVLMEASGKLCLRTGILPTQQIQIAAEHIKNVLSKIQTEFEINPILTTLNEPPQSETTPIIGEPDTISLPIPKENHVDWTWRDLKNESIERKVIEPQPVFQNEKPTILIDGFLKRNEQSEKKQ